MVGLLKQEGTSHSSRDQLKICVKIGASCSAQTRRQEGFSLQLQVQQFPSDVLKKPDGNIQLLCKHSLKDTRVMLWYLRTPGNTALKLIGYGYGQFRNDSVEQSFRKHFKLTGDLSGDEKNGLLTITGGFWTVWGLFAGRDFQCDTGAEAYFGKGTKLTVLEPERGSRKSFCSSGESLCSYNEAFFGAGTKLTVLDPQIDVTRPTVKVHCPFQREGRNKKTLVCVVSRFYPDHVSIFWQISGVNKTDGVATDSDALRDKKFYKMTSRLTIPAKTWFSPNKDFTCIVRFYDGSQYLWVNHTITGGGILSREKYLRITQSAKLSYGVLIVKSCIYGAFVSFLVWKLQSSREEENK
ncbi:M1-specific T cell receptor beta chain-like [Odontesthes bonariensis]|uniref:M1-specific T cell receptor beta chain-like n=1 Tax=Odontesthes bonariensis TaxID=219752 RepID=UPI003F58D37D